MKRIEKNDLFQVSQLTILICFTVFTGLLAGETFLMGWETWALLPIVTGLILSWVLHLQQRFTATARIWFCAAFIMFAVLFHGCHPTSVFDTVAVMAVVLTLCTMACMKSLITVLQLVYYVTLGYGLFAMYRSGEQFDSLIISRAVLHFAAITTISVVSRTTIDRWLATVEASHGEIEKLTDATERLNDFLANVSHETRTPINAIIGLTGICIDAEEDPERLENLDSVRKAGRRVAEQIGDILDFTEIDRGRLTNNYEDYMLSSVLNDLVAEIRPYKPKELELVIDVDPAIPSVMNSDIGKLRKILRHLIMNGLKYTQEGGVYVRLYAIPESYGVNLVIRVTDTGIGMTEEETERVFERYYQVDSGRTRKGGGLGLGMTIVRGFTTALGGFVTISSEPDVGTTVSVSLPQKVIAPASCMSLKAPEKLCLGAFLHLDKYADPNVREYYNMMIHNIVKGFGIQMHRVDNAANLEKLLQSVRLTHLFVSEEEYETAQAMIEKAAAQMVVVVVANQDFVLPADSRARIMEKPFYCFPVAAVLNADESEPVTDEVLRFDGVRALAVDDEPMNLTVAQNILRRYGITVTSANSGAEALELCRDREFDIVFMDHMMPGMDGIETMKRIRAGNLKCRSDVPVVALTANAVSTARETFLASGFDGFVSKPIELVELERVLRRVLPVSSAAIPAEQPQQTVTPPAEEDSAALIRRAAACGLDTASALTYCADDPDFYVMLLRQFIGETAEKLENMDAFLRENDLVNYEIIVHALKNTLKLIGADALSEQAKEMEFAAKAEDSALIAEKHGALADACRLLTSKLAAFLGEPEPAQEDGVTEFAPDETATGSEADDAVTEFEPAGAEDGVTESAPDGGGDADDTVIEFAPEDGEEDASEKP